MRQVYEAARKRLRLHASKRRLFLFFLRSDKRLYGDLAVSSTTNDIPRDSTTWHICIVLR